MPPSHPLCVSDPHPAPPPAQFCTAWFWAAGVWVAELGRKRGKGGIRVLGVHLATHACPRSMCLVQLTCSGTGDPTPPQKGLENVLAIAEGSSGQGHKAAPTSEPTPTLL